MRSGFTHPEILLEERGPVDGCEIWFYPHKNRGFTHTKILLEERGPVDVCEVWFYPHNNSVRGERTSGYLSGLVLPTQKSC